MDNTIVGGVYYKQRFEFVFFLIVCFLCNKILITFWMAHFLSYLAVPCKIHTPAVEVLGSYAQKS